ncbi:MAG: hypothetical protein ACP5N3_00545 [Candidatus Nanoarchaeia archaeon]
MANRTIELVSEEQVLSAVKSNGPVVPMDVRQVLKAGDSIIIGATLSTLVSRGILKVTNLKRGGSPFYYLPGQEEKLQDISKYLGEKDRRTFELLKQKQVLRDKEEEPLTRVSLRNIPDFAKRMEVEIAGEKEIVWRWYMINEEEAVNILKKSAKKEEPASEKKKEEIQEKKEEKEEKKEPQKETKEKKPRKKEKTEEDVFQKETQQQLPEQAAPQNIQSSIANFNDAFINKAAVFLSSGNINIKDSKQVKKGSEYDLIIEMPTFLGNIEYFCKVKAKKKCSEADLNSALVQGQNLRLPVLFLTTGEVVKKAKDKLRTDFKGMIVKEI